MSRTRWRAIVVLILMLGSTALSVLAVPTGLLSSTRRQFVLEDVVPRNIGDWRIDSGVTPIPPSPDQDAAMRKIYDQILARTYVDPRGRRVMLSITYGSRQNQQMRAHRQEVCYSAQGFRISGLKRLPLQIGGAEVQAARMVATQGPRVEPVTYWFTMGDYAVMSYLDRELVQLRYALQGQIPDGYLIRLSSISPDPEAAFKLHQEFADQMIAHLEPEVRRRLTGGQ